MEVLLGALKIFIVMPIFTIGFDCNGTYLYFYKKGHLINYNVENLQFESIGFIEKSFVFSIA